MPPEEAFHPPLYRPSVGLPRRCTASIAQIANVVLQLRPSHAEAAGRTGIKKQANSSSTDSNVAGPLVAATAYLSFKRAEIELRFPDFCSSTPDRVVTYPNCWNRSLRRICVVKLERHGLATAHNASFMATVVPARVQANTDDSCAKSLQTKFGVPGCAVVWIHYFIKQIFRENSSSCVCANANILREDQGHNIQKNHT